MGSQQDVGHCAGNNNNNVVITGFGPFRDHLVNPSWEAIKDPIKIDRPVNVIVKQVNVAYDTVDETIPKLWSTYQPLLMVHVGLAAHDSTLRLENHARSGPYLHADVKGCIPACKHDSKEILASNTIDSGDTLEKKSIDTVDVNNKTDVLEPNNALSTCLKLNSVIDKLKRAKEDGHIKLEASQSYDAGLYVCEYIYHKSLCHNSKTVFIHIPETNQFKLDEIKEALKLAIELLIDDALKSQ